MIVMLEINLKYSMLVIFIKFTITGVEEYVLNVEKDTHDCLIV